MEYISDNDCCFEQDGFWFRYRAAAIIIEEGCVLMAYSAQNNYYYSIGGGVHLGETSREAAAREAKEETGITYQPDRLVFTNESLFYENGKQCHVIEFYYLMKPKGRKLIKNGSIMDAAKKTSDVVTEHLQWIPLEKFSEYKAFPEFFSEKLIHMPETIEHLVSDERQEV